MKKCNNCPVYWNENSDDLGVLCIGDKGPNECVYNLQRFIAELEKKVKDKTEETTIIFRFETGDADTPYFDISVSVKGNVDIKNIEDSFTSYLESDVYSEDEEYEDSVKRVMDSSGLEWRFGENAPTYILTI